MCFVSALGGSWEAAQLGMARRGPADVLALLSPASMLALAEVGALWLHRPLVLWTTYTSSCTWRRFGTSNRYATSKPTALGATAPDPTQPASPDPRPPTHVTHHRGGAACAAHRDLPTKGARISHAHANASCCPKRQHHQHSPLSTAWSQLARQHVHARRTHLTSAPGCRGLQPHHLG